MQLHNVPIFQYVHEYQQSAYTRQPLVSYVQNILFIGVKLFEKLGAFKMSPTENIA